MQNLYMDEAKRLLKWSTNGTQPLLPITMDVLQDHFRKI
jgi:hypothetical protein